MPLARYALDEPQTFLYRGVTRMTSDEGTAPLNPAGMFIGNVRNALLMFNWRGDVVWVNSIPGLPTLDPVSGALFVLGCTYGLYRLVRYRELPFLYLFTLLFVGLLPSIMSLGYPHENPSVVRTGMAIPVVATLVMLPLALLTRRLRAWVGGPYGRVAAALGLAVVLVAMVRLNVDQYFRVYAEQHSRASQHTTYVADAVKGFIQLGGRKEDAYILPGAQWVDWRLVSIQVGDVRWRPLLEQVDNARAQDGVPRPRLYVVHPNDSSSLDKLRLWYPHAVEHVHVLAEEDGQPWFVTVLVPPGSTAAG
jgi:hypothetical protein